MWVAGSGAFGAQAGHSWVMGGFILGPIFGLRPFAGRWRGSWGCLGRARMPGCLSGKPPNPVLVVQTECGQSFEVQSGNAGLDPGMVLAHTEVTQAPVSVDPVDEALFHGIAGLEGRQLAVVMRRRPRQTTASLMMRYLA